MNDIMPFQYGSQSIRIVRDSEGEPWWVAKDVCQVLGLEDTHKAMERLDGDEKGRKIIPTLGGDQELSVVNEPGLYSLILRSSKPQAKDFKRWVTHEVLPAIRKTGGYQVAQGASQIDLIIQTAQAIKSQEQKLFQHDRRLTELEAKAHVNSGETGYWTVVAWCRLNHLPISLEEATRRGRDATKLSKEWGVPIGRVGDERWGSVNSYRQDVLEEVFSDLLTASAVAA